MPTGAGSDPTTLAANVTGWPGSEELADGTTVMAAGLPVVPAGDGPGGGTVDLAGDIPVVLVFDEVEGVVEPVVLVVAAEQAPFAKGVVVPKQAKVSEMVAVQVTVLAPVVPEPLH